MLISEKNTEKILVHNFVRQGWFIVILLEYSEKIRPKAVRLEL